MNKILTLFIFLSPLVLSAQDNFSDSTKTLDEVVIKAFEQNREKSLTTTSVKIVGFNNADLYNKTSLVNGFNTVAGVRMEERSPGSYRINIRGSSLRSPFGVRNVKVYWNDIPFTDAGGNTYFNGLAYNDFSYLEIFKGPASSLYGAGTGGLILMHTLDRWQPGTRLEYITGSYGLQNVFASARWGQKENKNQFTFAHNKSDGYREQTKMRRDNFSWVSQLKSSDRHSLTASVLFTDMYYQTPGALTLSQFQSNPKAARPAAGIFPGAVAAKAAIYQKNILAGISNEYSLTSTLRNTTTLYSSFAQVKNPAIRNYERRNEPQYGGRTTFVLTKKSGQTEWQWVLGSEFQQGFFNTLVSDNRNGNPDTIQTNDDIRFTTYNAFAQLDVNLHEKWFLTAGASINKSDVVFKRLNQYPVIRQSRSYKNEMAPRISIIRKFSNQLSVTGTVSKGFSPPSISELLPSTGVISTNLEAEHGWNYELTAKYYALKNKLYFELTGFYFKLYDALVQRYDPSGADYFVNAGDIKEPGVEFSADYSIYSFGSGSFMDYLILRASYTYNHFRYSKLQKNSTDYSGKRIPSVPDNSLSLLVNFQLKNGLYSNLNYYSASKVFLNDENTANSDPYHLLGCRIGWGNLHSSKHKLNFYLGIDNLLNENYSLGNDINAVGGRFYNAAPRRNFYIGAAWQWIKPKN
ncbi:MAG: TonB-dependent receptor [Bacteroidetes bacterium]|nr:TonB-dependent receptor [Bacteroidota bacterium]